MYPNLQTNRHDASRLADQNEPLSLVQKLVLLAPWIALLMVGFLLVG